VVVGEVRVAEDRGVVHPAGELAVLLGEPRGLAGDVELRSATDDCVDSWD
jgi:hypothetical protein